MELRDNNRKYIIPFDSVDLSLLPSIKVLPKFQESIMPLWNTDNLQQRNEDYYYEFEINQEENTTDCDTYCSSTVSDDSSYMDTHIEDSNFSSDMCYICNIDVPSVCMSEHLSSPKHKTFLKITEISLERVKKQMGTNYKNENLPVGLSFCSTCVALIPEEDTVSHIKLKTHKNAELIDKLLFDLLKIYSESGVADHDESENTSKLGTPKISSSRKVENIGTGNVHGLGRKVVNGKIYDGSSKLNEAAYKIITDNDKLNASNVYNDNLDIETANITIGDDKLDVNSTKIIKGTSTLDLDSAKIITGSSILNIDSAKITTDSVKLDADSAKITTGSAKSYADSAKITTGSVKLDADSAKITTGSAKLDVNSAIITRNCGKLDEDYWLKTAGASCKLNADKIKISANDIEAGIKIENKSVADVIYSKKRLFKCMSGNKDFEQRLNNNHDGNLNGYIRDLANSHYKIEVGDGNDVVIEIKPGLRVRVNMVNFHGLYALGKRHMLCILCKKIERDIKMHIYSNNHLHNLKLPIDENCIRELDDEKSHCIICNDTIEYPAVHALCSKEHDDKFKLSLVNDIAEKASSSTQARPAAEKIKIEDNAINITSETVNNDPVPVQSYSEVTKEPRKTSVDVNHIDRPVTLKALANVDQVDRPVTLCGKPEAICKVCYSSYDPADWNTHTQSPEHKSNEALLPHHLLEYSSTHRTLKCKVCVTGFPVHCKIQHISSPIHQNNYKKLLTVNKMKLTGRTVYCGTCVAFMRVGDELSHLTSPNHRSITTNTLAINELEKLESQEKGTAKAHYCKVCLVNVPGDTKNVKTHEDGARHKRNLALAEAKIKGQNIERTPDKVSPVLPMVYRYVIRATARPSEMECRICSTTLPNTVKNISEHLEGSSHKNNASSLEKDSIKLYRDVYWCEKCDFQVEIGEQFLHKATPQHTAKTKDEETNATKDPNSINSFYLNLLKSSESKGMSRCKVCGVTVPNSGSTLRMHFDGVKHRSQLMKLLKSNSLSGMGLSGEFNCTICYCRFPSDHLLDHIVRPRHLAGLDAPVPPADPKSNSHQKGPGTDVKDKSDQNKQEADGSSKSGQKNHNQNDSKANVEAKLDQTNHVEVKTKPEVVKVKSDPTQECVVCDVILTANEANINLHKGGSRHKNNLTIMEQNRIRVLDGGCYCEACDIKFSRNDLHRHIAGAQHLVMLG